MLLHQWQGLVFKNGLLHQKATGGRLKIKHKKNKVKLAVLQFYKVDDSGKVQRLKNECPNVDMARSYCQPPHLVGLDLQGALELLANKILIVTLHEKIFLREHIKCMMM
ncbi:uncharacterized protein LOC114294808 [Camellia sinensis]|uniref:uncharacterized protein LOC114294808 n=1 Tax=Camellia sinensis TaxID=4442 RepID=UPI001035F8E9|nr:uncharacterized protein LOC114294808 [Camellia sinensis]XP_028094757.1 uncharacterized protein LOC114294808 [Camellia sinensis]